MLLKLHSTENKLRLILPFINEIANILTLAGITNIYIHNAQGSNLINKIIIDTIALFGIIWNSVHTSHKHKSVILGLIKGFILLIFGFIIPNTFMHNIINHLHTILHLNYSTNSILFIGFIIIIILLLSDLILYNYLKKNITKFNEKLKYLEL